MTSIVWAGTPPKLEGVKPGVYPLYPIDHHTPGAFKNSDEYWKSLQEVKLEIGKQDAYRDLPKLGLKQPFTGKIILGDQPQEFAVIVDIFGEEKRLYVDTNGDGSFANEPYTVLLNEWQGLQAYWVLGPEPLKLQVTYSADKALTFPITLEVTGILNKPGAIYKERPYLRVAISTWFLARLGAGNNETLVAVVDRDNNGRFNDPVDQLFVDTNADGFFSKEEVIKLNRGISLRGDQGRLAVTWKVYPDKLVIGGK